MLPRINFLSHLRHKATATAYGTSLYQWSLGGSIPDRLAVIPPDPWPGDAMRGRRICQDVFSLAGEQLPVRDGDFEPKGISDVWLSHIHAFEWLRDLRALGGDQGRHQARAMITAWIDRYSGWNELSWRADLTGQRIAIWIALHDFLPPALTRFSRPITWPPCCARHGISPVRFRERWRVCRCCTRFAA